MRCLEPHRACAGIEGKGRLWWPQSLETVGAHSMSGAQIPAPGHCRFAKHVETEWAQADAERKAALAQGNNLCAVLVLRARCRFSVSLTALCCHREVSSDRQDVGMGKISKGCC